MRYVRSKTLALSPLRIEEVPKDLICSICLSIPLRPPMITPCQHLFCTCCIVKAVRANPTCPNCRSRCEETQLESISDGTIIHRIWSSIVVKCPHHERGCAWTGSIADLADHFELCPRTDNNAQIIAKMKEEISQLELQISVLEDEISEKESYIAALEYEALVANEQIESLRELQAQEPRHVKLPILFNGTYNYRGENVVALSQLISRYLENKPDKLDANKIYNCIRTCYLTLQKGYREGCYVSDSYETDMRMLLSTCYATCGWFSEKQIANIRTWLNEQGWL